MLEQEKNENENNFLRTKDELDIIFKKLNIEKNLSLKNNEG